MGVTSNILTADQLHIINDFSSMQNILFGGSLSLNVYGVYRHREIHDLDIIITSHSSGPLNDILKKYTKVKVIKRPYMSNSDGWTGQFRYKNTLFDIFHVDTLTSPRYYVNYHLCGTTMLVSHPLDAIEAKIKYVSYPGTSAAHVLKHKKDIEQYKKWITYPAFYYYWNNRTSAPYFYDEVDVDIEHASTKIIDTGYCWSFDDQGYENVLLISNITNGFKIISKDILRNHESYNLSKKIQSVSELLEMFKINDINQAWIDQQTKYKIGG